MWSASSAPTARPVENQFERAAVTHDARQADRSEVDERHAETAIVEAEISRARRDPHIAPERELHAARDRRPFDGGDRRLAERKPRRAHRPEVALGLDRARLAIGQSFQIGPGAKRAPGAGQHRDVRARVGVEPLEGVVERLRGHEIHRVAPLRTLDRHHGHALLGAYGNGRAHAGNRRFAFVMEPV